MLQIVLKLPLDKILQALTFPFDYKPYHYHVASKPSYVGSSPYFDPNFAEVRM